MGDRGTHVAAAVAFGLLAAGCAVDPCWTSAPQAPRSSRAERERQVNAEWENHTLRELVDQWGPPRLLLDIPGGGNPPGFVLVYGPDAGSGCIDAFAVTFGEVLRVRSYQCR